MVNQYANIIVVPGVLPAGGTLFIKTYIKDDAS